MANDFLYGVHEGLLFIGIVVLFYCGAEIGYRLGTGSSKKIGKDSHQHVATIEAALLGLFALLISFAFSMAMARYDARRHIVVSEANDIETTMLRAKLLPDEFRKVAMPLLKDYVDSRVDYLQAGLDQRKISEALKESAAIQTKIWNTATAAAKSNDSEVVTGYFIESLNNMIDDHTTRLAVMRGHVPEFILLLLVFVGCMTLAMTGYSSGLNKARVLIPRFILVVITAATLIVIVDLDRPHRGFITVSENALIELREKY